MPVFFGKEKPHLCDPENGTIAERYIKTNETNCQWNCQMETTYANDFDRHCTKSAMSNIAKITFM